MRPETRLNGSLVRLNFRECAITERGLCVFIEHNTRRRMEVGMDPSEPLGSRDALVLVDVQQDFCPGGSLPIEQGHDVVPILNRWIEDAVQAGAPVFASRDWHPEEHLSFHASGGPWPAHCIQDTEGALPLRSNSLHPARPQSTLVE